MKTLRGNMKIKSLTLKLAGLIMIVLGAGTPLRADLGRDWVRATTNAPWGASQSFGLAAVEFKGKLWVVGGGTGTSYTNAVWNTADGTNWNLATSSPGWANRQSHSCLVFSNRLWLLGGYGTGSRVYNDVWFTEDGTNWFPATSQAPWAARSAFGAADFNGQMFVIAGFTNNSTKYLNDVWRSPDGTNWLQVNTTPVLAPRHWHTCVVHNERLWLLSGQTNQPISSWLNEVWSTGDGTNWNKSPATNHWSRRVAIGAASLAGKLWVFGGTTNGASQGEMNDVWSSVDGTNWELVRSAAEWPGRYVFSSGVTFQNRLWVIGGWKANSGNLRDVWWSGDQTPSVALPQITQHPQSQTNNVGSNVIFSVSVTGTQPLTYRWRFNGTNLSDGARVVGATTTNVTISNLQTNDAGNYAVVVTNSYGSATSTAAVLTVSAAPHSGNESLLAGQYIMHEYGVELLGSEWTARILSDFDGAGNLTFTNLANSTGDLPGGSLAYSVDVAGKLSSTSAFGQVSADGKLFATADTSSAGNDLSLEVALKKSSGLSVSNAQGDYVLAELGRDSSPRTALILAHLNGDGTGTFTNLANSHGSLGGGDLPYTVAPDGTISGGGSTGVVASSGMMLAMVKTPLVGDISLMVGIRRGSGLSNSRLQGRYTMVEYGVDSFDTNAITYDPWTSCIQVDFDGAGLADFSVLEGSNGSGGSSNGIPYNVASNGTLTLYGRQGIVSEDGQMFLLVDTDPNDGDLSMHIGIKQISEGIPLITTQPRSSTNVVGSTASFNVSAAGSEPLIYQWRRDGTNLLNGGSISGVTTTNLTIANVQSNHAGNYTVVVSNAWGVATSAVASLTVGMPPSIILPILHYSSHVGTTSILSAAVSGTVPVTYQWQLGGTNLVSGPRIGGVTTTNLVISNTQTNDAGLYSLVVSNAFGSSTASVSLHVSRLVLEHIGSYSTNGRAMDVVIVGNLAYVAYEVGGLKILNIDDPRNPTLVGETNTSYAVGVAVAGQHAYIADNNGGLRIIEVSNPAQPQMIGHYSPFGAPRAVAVSGNYAYVAEDTGGLEVVDVSNPANSYRVGHCNTSAGSPSDAWSVKLRGTNAYVADYGSGLQIVDISSAADPHVTGSVGNSVNGYAVDVAIDGEYAYVADWMAGLQVINIGNPSGPYLVAITPPHNAAFGVAVESDYAYVASNLEGLQVFDVHDPTSPRWCGSQSTAGYARRVAVAGNFAYVAADYGGLQVLRIWDIPVATWPFRVTSVTRSGQSVTLQWASVPEQSYSVEASSNLRDWLVVASNLIATDTTLTFSIDMSDTQKFFRIYRQP